MKKATDITLISTAAANATAAANSAAEAAASAAENARVAAKAAAESATAIAVVATDTSWMKKSLSGIEMTLAEMRNAYVTAAQHIEISKRVDDHELRLNAIETEKTRQTVLLVVGGSLLTLLSSLVIWHLVGR